MTRLSRKKLSKSRFRTKKTYQYGGYGYPSFGTEDFRSQNLGKDYSISVSKASITDLSDLLYEDVSKILLENKDSMKTSDYKQIIKEYGDIKEVDDLDGYDSFVKSGKDFLKKIHELNDFGKSYGGYGLETSKEINTLNKFYEAKILETQILVVTFLKLAKTAEIEYKESTANK